MLIKDTERSFQISVVWIPSLYKLENAQDRWRQLNPCHKWMLQTWYLIWYFRQTLSQQNSQIPQSLQPICLSEWVKEVNTWTELGKFVVTGRVSKPRLNSMCTLIIVYAITNRELCVCCRSVILSVLGRPL